MRPGADDAAEITDGTIRLRPATRADADRLLAWRNDPGVRQASHATAVVTAAEHRRWLEAALADPARRLFIAEEAGVPVGTVRADTRDGTQVLSWAVAPEARGRGIGKRMVALLADHVAGPVRAEVKTTNPASARIAEAAGLTLAKAAGGVWYFERRRRGDRAEPEPGA